MGGLAKLANLANYAPEQPESTDHNVTPAEQETRRIPESVETEWKKAMHPLDLESQGKQKIHWVTAYCPELGISTDELEAWYRDDLKDIAKMPLEHVYRIIRDYVNLRRYYRRGMQ